MPSAEAMTRAGRRRRSRSRPRRGSRSSTARSSWRRSATLALLDAERLCTVADVAGAMSLEALKGSSRPFDERLQAARPHPGQAVVARNLRALLADSEIMESHKHCGKVQDAYSLRCMPQVHGATRDALGVGARRCSSARSTASPTTRASSSTDDGAADIISGGNFHGQPLALALDLAAMAAAELANISERRVEQLVNPALSTGLTPFLAPRGRAGCTRAS